MSHYRRQTYEVYPTLFQSLLLAAYEKHLRWLWNSLLAYVLDELHKTVTPRKKKNEIAAACAHIADPMLRIKAEREFAINDATRYHAEIKLGIKTQKWTQKEGRQALRTKVKVLLPVDGLRVSSNIRDEIALSLLKAMNQYVGVKNKGFPRFKKSDEENIAISITVPLKFKVIKNELEFSLFEIDDEPSRLRFNKYRDMPSNPTSLTLRRHHGKWKVTFVVRVEDLPQAPDKSIGIDRGITNIVADSEGRLIEPVIISHLEAQRLEYWSQRVSARVQGSNRYKKALTKRLKTSIDISNRCDAKTHEISKYYADNYRTIVVEDLRILNMVASASGTVDEPGTNVAQKSGLNKAILRQNWGKLVTRCEYKAEQRLGRLVKVVAAGTSIECNKCHYSDKANRVSQSEFICLQCGHKAHADINAACNILDRESTRMVQKKISKCFKSVKGVKRKPAGSVVT